MNIAQFLPSIRHEANAFYAPFPRSAVVFIQVEICWMLRHNLEINHRIRCWTLV
jgi:hypothetical protein